MFPSFSVYAPFIFPSFGLIFFSQLEYSQDSKCMAGILTAPFKNQRISTQLLEPNFQLFRRKPKYGAGSLLYSCEMDGIKLSQQISRLVHSSKNCWNKGTEWSVLVRDKIPKNAKFLGKKRFRYKMAIPNVYKNGG